MVVEFLSYGAHKRYFTDQRHQVVGQKGFCDGGAIFRAQFCVNFL